MTIRQCGIANTIKYAGKCNDYEPNKGINLNGKICWCDDKDGCNGGYRAHSMHYFIFVVLKGLVMTMMSQSNFKGY